jgi:hypothetical protein
MEEGDDNRILRLSLLTLVYTNTKRYIIAVRRYMRCSHGARQHIDCRYSLNHYPR